ncbi:hypothetical protein ACOSQ3_007454 [Xanthoceras sorbifolium]
MICSSGALQASCVLAHTGSALLVHRSLAPVLHAPPLSLIFFAHCHYCLHQLFLLTRTFNYCRPAFFNRLILPIAGDYFLTASIVALVDRQPSPIRSSCFQLSTASSSTGLDHDLLQSL